MYVLRFKSDRTHFKKKKDWFDDYLSSIHKKLFDTFKVDVAVIKQRWGWKGKKWCKMRIKAINIIFSPSISYKIRLWIKDDIHSRSLFSSVFFFLCFKDLVTCLNVCKRYMFFPFFFQRLETCSLLFGEKRGKKTKVGYTYDLERKKE